MQKKITFLCLGTVLVLGFLAALTRPRTKPSEPKLLTDQRETPPPSREESEDARREILREMGRKGAAKSAEVRRAKKAEREKAASVVPA